MECQNYFGKCPLHAIARTGYSCNYVDPVNFRFNKVLTSLSNEWQQQGIDPDSMLKCAEHQELMFNPYNKFEPTWHYMHAGEDPNKDNVMEGTSSTIEELREVYVLDDNGIQQGDVLSLSKEDIAGMACQLPPGWTVKEIR
jgi:hypothetical protein